MIYREVVDRLDRTTVERFVTRALQVIRLVGTKANAIYSMMICQAFANQTRLWFCDVGFGDGSPVLVAPLAFSSIVAVIISATPWAQMDVPAFLSLRPRLMETSLKKQFLDDLATLVY